MRISDWSSDVCSSDLIGEARAEQLAGAIDRELLGYVDMFAAAIITLAGIAFGIFVGEDRALGLQHRRGDDVLRRDQFKLVPLAIEQLGRASGREGVCQCG